MFKGLVIPMGIAAAQMMCGWYLHVTPAVSAEMRGRRSTVDTTVVYTEGLTATGDTVCVAWLPTFFPEMVEADLDSVYLCTEQF